ncbi:hypothetical protein SDJN02_16345, partial [Cucurbita argyrosperma subsp. argyrosperma]
MAYPTEEGKGKLDMWVSGSLTCKQDRKNSLSLSFLAVSLRPFLHLLHNPPPSSSSSSLSFSGGFLRLRRRP